MTQKSTGGIGKAKFVFEHTRTDKLAFFAETECVLCGREMVILHGGVHATFRIGNEWVGIACDLCLDARSQAILRERRMAQEDA